MPKKIAAFAVLLWISYGITLLPLPSRVAGESIASSKEQLAKPPWTQPDWDQRSESEREETRKLWAETERGGWHAVDEAKGYELVLWIKWGLRLLLVLVGIVAWRLLLSRRRLGRALVVATTVVLIVEQAFFHSAVYADLFSAWTGGYSGFKLLPWSKTIATVYVYFILPILLSTLTAIAIWVSTTQRRTGEQPAV